METNLDSNNFSFERLTQMADKINIMINRGFNNDVPGVVEILSRLSSNIDEGLSTEKIINDPRDKSYLVAASSAAKDFLA